VVSSRGEQPAKVPLGRKKVVVLVVLGLGQFMSLLDTTAVNVSLPSIQRDLHISQVSLSWVLNAYLVTFGAFLLVAGRLGDLAGRKQVFIAGLGVFSGASLLCGLSNTATMLVCSRFVQGIGAALECAMILGIIVSMFPEAAQRNRAIGIYAFLGAAGGSIGLLLGGVVTATIGWNWIFFINIPVGVVAMVVGGFVIDRHQGLGIGQGVDVAGGVLITAASLLAVGGFVEAGTHGWSSATTLGALVGAVVLGLAFLWHESRHLNPLIPLRVLRSWNLVCAGISRAMFCFGSYGASFLLVLYIQQVLGYGSLANGVAFLPNVLILSVFALTLTPALMARITVKRTHLVGLAGFVCGLALLLRIPVHGTYWDDVLPAMVVLGIGGGLYTVPNVAIAMAESPADDSGLVSGVINVSQQLGAAMGVAVLASVSAIRTNALSAAGEQHAAAVVGGFHLGFVVAIGALLVAMVAALLVRPVPISLRPDTGTEVAEQITEVQAR
jgi:EmrB/QacA subfamily drug resistance transporter